MKRARTEADKAWGGKAWNTAPRAPQMKTRKRPKSSSGNNSRIPKNNACPEYEMVGN